MAATSPVAKFTKTNRPTQDGASWCSFNDGNCIVASRIVDRFACAQVASPNMTVGLDPGYIFFPGTAILTEIAAQISGTITAPSANPRIDRVVIDNTTCAISMVTGTESVSPVPPAIPVGKSPVAQIGNTALGSASFPPGTIAITNGMIADEREFSALGTGTAAGNIVALDGSARLPAVDGSQLINLPIVTLGSAQGLKAANDAGTPSTKIDITAIAAVMANSSGLAVLAKTISVVIDLTTGTSSSAANGMDGEARGTSNWIALYLISNGTTVAGLASLNGPATGPTLPTGYTYSLYVGSMRVDGSGNLYRMVLRGRRAQWVVVGSSNVPNLPVIASGIAGNATTGTYVALATGNYVPPTASRILLVVGGFNQQIVIVAPNNAYGSGVSTANPPPINLFGDSGDLVVNAEMALESTNIYWASNGASNALFAFGWEDAAVAA